MFTGNSSRGYYVTSCLAATSVLIALCPGVESVLQCDRAAITGGQWWRVLTGHLTHFGLDHFLWDTAVFVVLGAMCERRSRQATRICLGIAALLIPTAIWLLMPEMATYRGLSGLDTALFALLAGMLLSEKVRERSRVSVTVILMFLLAMVGKIAWEFFTGGTLFVDSSSGQFVPVPLAHLVGAIVGLMVSGACAIQSPLRVSTLGKYHRLIA